MSSRDDFTAKTKSALALRSGYKCSIEQCGVATVGPSDESKMAVANIGIAAHICAAAEGGRRYDSLMSPEDRANISNGIWVCATCSALIDRDDVKFTVERLHEMKQAHEKRCANEIGKLSQSSNLVYGLIALGPTVIFVGEVIGITESCWTIRIDHFVIGDITQLIALINNFSEMHDTNRYILSNEIGDGRVVDSAPRLKKDGVNYVVECPIRSSFLRRRVQDLGTDLALSPNKDIFSKNGDIAIVSGLSALPQKIEINLSTQKGERMFRPESGVAIREYYEILGSTPWFAQLIKLEAIRLSAIPLLDSLSQREYTPFQCVERVNDVEVLNTTPDNKRLPIRVSFDVKGVGNWTHTLGIFLDPESRRYLPTID